MKPTNESVQWDCAECGCRNGAAFGTASFVCPACGYEAFDDDLRTTYHSIRKALLRKPSFSGFDKTPFQSDSVPAPALEYLRDACPFLSPPAQWSDLALFDVLWILRAAPDAASVLPLRTIGQSFWNSVEKATDDPTASFVAALGNRKANAASALVREGNASNLRNQERLLTEFGWSRWTKPEREKIARNLLDSVLRTSNKQTIHEFSPETQLNLWRTDPVRSGIDIAPLASSLSPSDFIFALGRGIIKPDILESAFFNWWTPKDWLALLRLPGLVLPDKVKIEISSRWNEFGWSAGTLADLVAENPNVRHILPVLSSGTTADLFLKHPEFSSWMATDGWFNRIATQDWLRILSNEEVLLKTEVLDYARRSVLPGLSDSDRDRLIEKNLDIAAFYSLDTLPEETVVDLYVAGRHDACFDSFDFSFLSRSGWLSLLSRCGERIPPTAAGFFFKEGDELDTVTIESLLSGNTALLPFFSEKQISRLSTETFLRLCKRSGAPDFLVSAYPVNTWTRKSQEEFLARYPWTEKYFNWTSWPIREVARLVHDNPMLEQRWPHKRKLFFWNNWKTITKFVSLFTCGFGLVLLGLAAPIVADAYRKEAMAKVRTKEALIAAETRSAREAESASESSRAAAAEAFARGAEAAREEQLSRERVALAADALATEEAAARRAADERVSQEAKLSRAVAEQNAEFARLEQLRISEQERDRIQSILQTAIQRLKEDNHIEARTLLQQVDHHKAVEFEERLHDAETFADLLSQAMGTPPNPYAAFTIGRAYYYGTPTNIVLQDHRRAADWFEKAALGGCVPAQHSLGTLYQTGQGVPQNDKRAARFFREAYQQGDWAAGFKYGLYLYNGGFKTFDTSEQNIDQAYAVFDRCAEKGNPDALYYRGVCRCLGTGVVENKQQGLRDMREAKRRSSLRTDWDFLLTHTNSNWK